MTDVVDERKGMVREGVEVGGSSLVVGVVLGLIYLVLLHLRLICFYIDAYIIFSCLVEIFIYIHFIIILTPNLLPKLHYSSQISICTISIS